MKRMCLLVFVTLALAGCRLYWHDDFFLLAVGETVVKRVEYIQEPNSMRFCLEGYDAGEKVVPSATGLILGNE